MTMQRSSVCILRIFAIVCLSISTLGGTSKEVKIEYKDVECRKVLLSDAGTRTEKDHTNLADTRIDELKPVHAPYTFDLSKIRKPDLTNKPDWGGIDPGGNRISVNTQYIELNGHPWIMVSGEMHPTRYPVSWWEEQILKMKAGGLNTIAVYIFWNNHEEDEGVFNWTGNRDIRHFIELCKKYDMKVFLRVGPFCNGECINGGLPQFLKDKGVKFRTNDPTYFEYVNKLYQQIGKQVK